MGKKKKENRGGSRPGAGRKPSGAKKDVVQIRVYSADFAQFSAAAAEKKMSQPDYFHSLLIGGIKKS